MIQKFDKRTREIGSHLALLFLLIAMAFAVSFCSTDDGDDDDDSGTPSESQSVACDAYAEDACSRFAQCTGTVIDDCLANICDELGDGARSCMAQSESCDDFADCLPFEGSNDYFDDDDDNDVDDDDDDTGDDDDDDDDDSVTELLENRSFDLGRGVAWEEISGGGYELIYHSDDAPINPHTTDYLAWLGGYETANDRLSQVVTIPAGTVAGTCSCYIQIRTSELRGTPFDLMDVKLLDNSGGLLTTLANLSNTDSSLTWKLKSWPVTGIAAWAGQSVRLALEATTDATYNTSFYVDTCSFTVTE
jgi:hypothetical protein